MKTVKVILSIPVILILLYFLPVIGVIALITRYILIDEKHYFMTPAVIAIVGLVALIPRGFELLQQNFNFNITIPFLSDFLALPIYPKITDYGKFCVIIAIVFFLLSALLRKFLTGLGDRIVKAFSTRRQEELTARERVAQENDLKIREQKLEMEQTELNVVKCPHCGKINHIKGKTGTCKSCRTPISAK